MPNTTVYTNNQYYQDIADAIRSKNGDTASYKPSQMAPAINALIVSGESISLQSKTVNPTTSTQTVFADTGYNALSQVTVNAIQTETKTVTENGTVRPTEGKYLTLVNVAVTASDVSLEDKIVTPTESEQTVTAGMGYQGLGTVTIAAVPNDYVGSGITRRIEDDLTTNGAYISAPAGYYSSTVSKSVATATQATPTISVNASGLISATVTQGTGYVTAGTKTATEQLLTQTGTTIIPGATSQTAVTSGKYTTGTITVASVPSETATLTTNGTHTPTSGKWFSSVTVSIPSDINNQNKTVTPTESEQEITHDAGYSGLGTVTVEAIDNTYVGSAIDTYSSADLTANGATVNVPAGYYPSNASKSVATATQATPSISIDNNGKIVATANQTAGYVATGSKSANLQMTTKTGTTITPSTVSQAVVAKNVYTLGTITVAPVPTETATLTSNGTHNATSGKFWSSVVVAVPSDINNQNKTVTPTESAQTISADSGYSGLGTVTVGAISSTYIGSEVPRYSGGTGIETVTWTYSQNNTYPYISHTVSISEGYNAGHPQVSSTLILNNVKDLPKQAAATITPSTATQTAVAKWHWTTGDVIVAAVPTDTSNTFSTNGTYTPASGKWFDEVTVAVPSDINNEAAKTVTPSTATQTITPGSGYSGLSKVTVNPIPSNYITTSDATATASHILNGDTAYVNGSKVIGTMTNNGATGTTLTSQGSTYAIPAGYTSGGTVTVSLPVSTISNANLNVSTITESTNDYGVEASITIPAGYYNNTTLTTTISDVLPVPATAAVVSQILSGYEAYDYQGKLLAGTMTNRAAWNATLNDTVTSTTIPAGYHNGSGTVSHTTVNIPDPTISIVNSTGVITASGSWTKGFTTDNSYTKTYTLTTQAGKTITPSETAQTAVASYRWTTGTITVAAISSTYVGSGVNTVTQLNTNANTVTAPAGYYASALTYTVPAMTVPTSTSASGTGTRKITVTPATTSQYINLPTGYNSSTAYFQINAMASGSATPQATISATGASVTAGNNTLTFTKSITLTPQVSAGYISAGTAAARTVTLTATVTTKAAATYTPSTATQTIAANQYLTGAQTIAPIPSNYITTSDATATASDIISPKTAYVNGSKITGNVVVNKYYTGTSAPASSLGNNGDIYFQNGGSL